MTIKAIETRYKGYRFRSRLEARWAVFFDAIGVEWEYEKEGFDLGEAGWYLPDFWLPKFTLWVEIKPGEPSKEEYAKLSALVKATEGGSGFFLRGEVDYIKPPLVVEEESTPDGVFIAHVDGGWKSLPGIDDDNHPDMKHVVCPVCAFDYVHFGQAVYTPSDDGTAWKGGRGSALRIPMYCENGCKWDYLFGFHKGFTFTKIENARTYLPLLWLAGGDAKKLEMATIAARSARFEHGETPNIGGK